ncbi:MAG: S4 domain-containing protein YaaA [Bacilli bacterium]|nr:S4 domain-containing protein YaaA [Bacilli bacterium]
MKNVSIRTEYITLGQLLKLISVIQSGGEAKMYLMMNDVFVNGDKEERRGKKLFPGDRVVIDEAEFLIQSK